MMYIKINCKIKLKDGSIKIKNLVWAEFEKYEKSAIADLLNEIERKTDTLQYKTDCVDDVLSVIVSYYQINDNKPDEFVFKETNKFSQIRLNIMTALSILERQGLR